MNNLTWHLGLYFIQLVVLIGLAFFQDQLIKDNTKIFGLDPENGKNVTKMDLLVLVVWGLGMTTVCLFFYPNYFHAPADVYPAACELPEKINYALIALLHGWIIFKVILKIHDLYDKRHARVCVVEGMIFLGVYSLLFFLLV
ncbi:MAG: hypothetical protein WCO30_00750 [bacterium]